MHSLVIFNEWTEGKVDELQRIVKKDLPWGWAISPRYGVPNKAGGKLENWEKKSIRSVSAKLENWEKKSIRSVSAFSWRRLRVGKESWGKLSSIPVLNHWMNEYGTEEEKKTHCFKGFKTFKETIISVIWLQSGRLKVMKEREKNYQSRNLNLDKLFFKIEDKMKPFL